METRLLQENITINNIYEVESFLGEGGFAEVYRVKHQFLGRQAMKVLKAKGLSLNELKDLLSEAVILSQFAHPNIIRVFDANVYEDPINGKLGFFTMEFIPGGTLEKFWQSHRSGFVPIEDTIEIIKQVSRGLAVAHQENPPIVHRDIKPQNILIGYTPNGINAKISDFGLAKNINPLKRMVSAKGTVIFKPPEVFKDPMSDSLAGDIWALGCTLYLMLTDSLPFSLDKQIEKNGSLNYKCFESPLTPPGCINISVNEELDQIVLKALNIDRESRYQNATEFLKDLEKWKPDDTVAKKSLKMDSSDRTKSALGSPSERDEKEIQEMVKEALKLANQAITLNKAADIMEEAINKYPPLREKYESRLKLWRMGIIN